MAERRPASPEPASSSAVSTAFGSPLEPVAALPPPPSRRSPQDTYVVKVQKDQIYRVPPPENAYLAERYRAGPSKQSSSSSSSWSPCVVRAVGALLATAALVGAAIAICVVILRPGLPGFSVHGLSVTVHAAGNGQPQQRVDYDVFLTAVNPNKMTALWYRDGGAARLTHEASGALLAKGVVGQPADGGEDATDFTVVLHGVQQHGGRAPRAVEKAIESRSRDHVALRLTVEATVQVHIGALGFAQRRLAVDCEVVSAGLRKDVHIASQKCRSVFRN
ncbi:hypothetical protein PR202_gb18857 [Eleusine coracana subsp. coracana]|uniref:Late embryogenesis abundant protein LEA-2 subgroup domain-containing protein n=1 Tax=Eleusine coracana subsp. coracana TaxID=191504 RepID=A0AAV5F6N8_ELECO|nr:hypothetical protein QOZ80_3BG0291140 [Eleusine coracana subsp. coracana]GJN30544.1 hypothetical protein PR202_gb18857 [Eleusine coracana subsp. coracana]